MNKVINFMKTNLRRPIVVRALHTFAQAFLAVLLVGGFKLDKVTLVAALAAGLSALKSLTVQSLESRKA